jgi:hypothetical protein
MNSPETARRLSELTDEGVFERLATSILRAAKPEYRSLLHPGVNPAGKTVKSAVDGIGFVEGATPPHLIMAHHTTCARDGLRRKWLHDPDAAATPKRRHRPVIPAGDLLKAVALFSEQKQVTPSLKGTVVLTSNQEPSDELVLEIRSAATARGLEIDIWSVSLLAEFLDNDPSGQWLRQQYLGIGQQRLSKELLAKLSDESLAELYPNGHRAAWVSRELDLAVAEAKDRDVIFVIAESGLGKTVACCKRLEQHLASGGFGFVLSHDAIAASSTAEQAIDAGLRQLHPLAGHGAVHEALALCSSDRPLLVVVEDINKSGQASALAEKLARWSTLATSAPDSGPQSRRWRLLCPVWPSVVASLRDDQRKRVQQLAIAGTAYTPAEGREAVKRRAKIPGILLSDLEADSISDALGHDPLLIALHEPGRSLRSGRVIDDFIDGSVQRLAQQSGEYTPADFRSALRSLSQTMLVRRDLDPRWQTVTHWFGAERDILSQLRRLVNFGEVIKHSGHAGNERLAFRHDRVRDALLADAFAEMMRDETLDDSVLGEPYFAEIVGAALLQDAIPEAIVDRVRTVNPLALFHSLRLFREPSTPIHEAVLRGIETWLADIRNRGARHVHLRWEALVALSETESSKVIAIVRQFGDYTWAARQALFRNGDVTGGLHLCLDAEPWTGAIWRDRQIEHAKVRFGGGLRKALDDLLRRPTLEPRLRIGALRLVGYLADPQLAEAIEVAWRSDDERDTHLEDYLWAAAQCCGSDPSRFLAPVCDAWAALPNVRDNNAPSPRDDLAAHTVNFAFRKHIPVSAIGYFIERARSEDLRWPLTYMLHSIDHPDVIEFVVRELAETDRKFEGTKLFSPFSSFATDVWRRGEEELDRPMSDETRGRLLSLWQNAGNDKHVRQQAFRFWATAERNDDLAILRAVDPTDSLADSALWQRLRRRDQTAIPEWLVKLKGDDRARWWHLGSFIWSDQISRALDEELSERGTTVAKDWGVNYKTDYPIFQQIMRLPPAEAEGLLAKHWDHLRFNAYFVQTALYIATPRLLAFAKQTIESCPQSGELFNHIGSHYGIRTYGREGVTRPAQIEALVPYLDYLNEHDVFQFWDACNSLGWFDLRRRHFDPRHSEKYGRRTYDDEQIIAIFDDMVQKNDFHWIDHQIERITETGVTVEHVLEVIGGWLRQRGTFEALRLAAMAIVHAGGRKDLAALNISVMPQDAADNLVADAQFAVKRRRLL